MVIDIRRPPKSEKNGRVGRKAYRDGAQKISKACNMRLLGICRELKSPH